MLKLFAVVSACFLFDLGAATDGTYNRSSQPWDKTEGPFKCCTGAHWINSCTASVDPITVPGKFDSGTMAWKTGQTTSLKKFYMWGMSSGGGGTEKCYTSSGKVEHAAFNTATKKCEFFMAVCKDQRLDATKLDSDAMKKFRAAYWKIALADFDDNEKTFKETANVTQASKISESAKSTCTNGSPGCNRCFGGDDNTANGGETTDTWCQKFGDATLTVHQEAREIQNMMVDCMCAECETKPKQCPESSGSQGSSGSSGSNGSSGTGTGKATTSQAGMASLAFGIACVASAAPLIHGF